MSADLGPAFARGIENHYYLEYDSITPIFRDIFHTDKMTGRYTDDQLWELYGLPKVRRPGEAVAQDSIKTNYAKRYVPYTVGLGDSIAWEDWEDDQYGILHRALPAKGGALARMFTVFQEKAAASIFTDLGWVSGTSIAGSADGVSLFNTAHPVSLNNSGTTVSNRPSTEVDLSIASITAMRNNLVTQIAPNNVEYLSNKPRIIVGHPSLRTVAMQCINGTMERGTTDNNINVLRDYNLRFIEWPYFQKSGSTGTNNAWFSVGETHYLKFFLRNDFQMKSDFEVSVLAYIFVAFMRLTFGWTDWRGTYGSLGI